MKTNKPMQLTLNGILGKARAQVVQYPQYSGAYFQQFTMWVTFKKDVKTKAGLAFKKGEVAPAKFETFDGGERMLVAWSYRNAIATSVKTKDVVQG